MSAIADSILDVFKLAMQMGEKLTSTLEARLNTLRAAIYAEERRIAAAVSLSIIAALCAFSALTFGALAIMVAAWPTHPVLSAALIAMGFALLAALTILAIRSNTR